MTTWVHSAPKSRHFRFTGLRCLVVDHEGYQREAAVVSTSKRDELIMFHPVFGWHSPSSAWKLVDGSITLSRKLERSLGPNANKQARFFLLGLTPL